MFDFINNDTDIPELIDRAPMIAIQTPTLYGPQITPALLVEWVMGCTPREARALVLGLTGNIHEQGRISRSLYYGLRSDWPNSQALLREMAARGLVARAHINGVWSYALPGGLRVGGKLVTCDLWVDMVDPRMTAEPWAQAQADCVLRALT